MFAVDLNLILVRHGESVANAKGCFAGRMDFDLTVNGQNQVEQLAQKLTAHGLSYIYSSPLIRAKRTADSIASACGLTANPWPDLIEQDYGLWDGLCFSEVKRRYDSEFQAWMNGDPGLAPPKGESLIDVHKRASRVVDQLKSKFTGGEKVALVAHAGFLQAVICCLVGTPLSNRWPYRLQTATYTWIEIQGDRASLTHLSCS